MNEIGGYFELELRNGHEYHKDAIKVNLARKAFEYILKARGIQKVYIPYFTCEVMLEPFENIDAKYEYYHIDELLEPVFDYSSLRTSDFFLYTNYFGLKDHFINQLKDKVKNLIIDNAQAFYSKPHQGVDTFYSARKFFGVSDGGYLYTDKTLDEDLETDKSSDRFRHLLGKIENGAEAAYILFKENDDNLCGQTVKKMSLITQRILQSIDYESVAEVRRRNFIYLHEHLADKNKLNIDLSSESVPLVYPFLTDNPTLREYLIRNKVYVALYWPNVLEWCLPSDPEYMISSNMVNLPVDQRVGPDELKFMLRLLSLT